MLTIISWSVIVWILFQFFEAHWLLLPFTPIGIIGSALAIFVGFRNNSAYSRWWEARQVWGGIVNSSRVLARLIITFTDSHAHKEQHDKQRSELFKKSMVLKAIAWVHALRLQLRAQDDWYLLKTYVTESEYWQISEATNKPFAIHMLMGKEVYQAMSDGTLGGFDSFQMEGQLLALTNYQGSAERIKHTPLPRQYDYFTRLFIMLFAMALPLGLLSILTISWLVIPLSSLVAGVFVIMERTGAANENPFENQVTDVPLTSICNTIERDLLGALGGQAIPEITPIDKGYLY